MPAYAGIETLADTGDAVQWGGRHLCAGGGVPHARRPGPVLGARRRRRPPCPPGTFVVATRRGKQFNSMVLRPTSTRSPAPAATRCFIDEADAAALGLGDGDAVRAALRHRRAATAGSGWSGCPARTLQVHWPEGNVLIAGGPEHREPRLAGARLQRRRDPRAAPSTDQH